MMDSPENQNAPLSHHCITELGGGRAEGINFCLEMPNIVACQESCSSWQSIPPQYGARLIGSIAVGDSQFRDILSGPGTKVKLKNFNR